VKALRERDIERRLVERVKQLGGEVRKVSWIGRRGAPDRLAMLPAYSNPTKVMILSGPQRGQFAERDYTRPARTIWVELKTPGKKAEPHQAREHERMRRMGQRVEVVESFERIEEILS
jgi:hypothetical protein